MAGWQNAGSRNSTDWTSVSSDQPQQQGLVASQQSSLPIKWLYAILHTVTRRDSRSRTDDVSESSRSSSISYYDTDSEASSDRSPEEKQRRILHYFSEISGRICETHLEYDSKISNLRYASLERSASPIYYLYRVPPYNNDVRLCRPPLDL